MAPLRKASLKILTRLYTRLDRSSCRGTSAYFQTRFAVHYFPERRLVRYSKAGEATSNADKHWLEIAEHVAKKNFSSYAAYATRIRARASPEPAQQFVARYGF